MADNVTYQSTTPSTPPNLTVISTEEVTTLNGGAVAAQQIQRVAVAVRTADGVAVDLPASTADGLLVNLGSNNDVTVTGSVAVTDGGGSLTVDGTVAATQSGAWIISANSGIDIGDVTINNAAGGSAVNIQDGGNSLTVDGTVAVSGTVTTSETNATTGTRTSVNDVATDVQLLASNASRRVAIIFNDSTEILYLALGAAAASLTDYTAQLFPRGYFETPYRYTGEIRGIWANNASGAARITELT